MIKKQYDYFHTEKTYFTNFLNTLHDARAEVSDALKPYRATVHKSKARYRYNIKFHDPKQYMLFVLEWSS
jgi:hypothetical protein